MLATDCPRDNPRKGRITLNTLKPTQSADDWLIADFAKINFPVSNNITQRGRQNHAERVGNLLSHVFNAAYA